MDSGAEGFEGRGGGGEEGRKAPYPLGPLNQGEGRRSVQRGFEPWGGHVVFDGGVERGEGGGQRAQVRCGEAAPGGGSVRVGVLEGGEPLGPEL